MAVKLRAKIIQWGWFFYYSVPFLYTFSAIKKKRLPKWASHEWTTLLCERITGLNIHIFSKPQIVEGKKEWIKMSQEACLDWLSSSKLIKLNQSSALLNCPWLGLASKTWANLVNDYGGIDTLEDHEHVHFPIHWIYHDREMSKKPLDLKSLGLVPVGLKVDLYINVYVHMHVYFKID